MTEMKLINKMAEACDDKLAKNIVVLDMQGISLLADYFLICHGENERQVQAIARSLQDTLEENDIAIEAMEGIQQSRWVVVDAGNIICHVFHKDDRNYYHIERLWGDAKQVPLTISQKG